MTLPDRDTPWLEPEHRHTGNCYGVIDGRILCGFGPPWDPDPLTVPEPPSDTLPSSPGTAVWIVAAGLVGLALVVGIAGYLASRS